jgi:hypothetical protein
MGVGWNETYCLQGCDPLGPRTQCPDGYRCTDQPLSSVDPDVTGPQCYPATSGTCEAPTAACEDDSWEDNDSLYQAIEGPALDPNTTYSMTSCPAPVGGDEDWFKIEVSEKRNVTVRLLGGPTSDLDLVLYEYDEETGLYEIIKISRSVGSSDEQVVEQCLPAGTYYVEAYAPGVYSDWVTNDYTLGYEPGAVCP